MPHIVDAANQFLKRILQHEKEEELTEDVIQLSKDVYHPTEHTQELDKILQDHTSV